MMTVDWEEKISTIKKLESSFFSYVGKKLTQKQLAEQIKISNRTISKSEHGYGCPDISLLPSLSTLLDVNIESI
ncbi:helix-turn-helix transcriptional regulator [Robertmurraya sp. DFI.2.37]|uniref:helix-turn-helix domain-containing protein n=1 Tax=Robertmurraya sp. DFI.2.37 TaxID=3031819 RepID=UPI0027954BB7|nr:helix-turn-helix transcriptional regulator [Robertmurraya sp. DFI.2.37]